MKITKLLFAILLFIPLFQSCQNDVTDTGDPRDAIAKKWRVTDNYDAVGALGYDVTITKDANEATRILITNFGGWDSPDKLYASLANKTITIPTQTLGGIYTITNGTGTIDNNIENIEFTYTVTDPDNIITHVTAKFGQNFVKKKVTKPVL